MMEGDGRTDIGDPFKDSNSKFSSSLAVSLSINRRSFFSTEFVISSDMLDNSQLGLDLLPWTPRSYSAAAVEPATHEGRRRARGGRIRYSRFYDTGLHPRRQNLNRDNGSPCKQACHTFRPESLERCSLGNKSQLSVCHWRISHRTIVIACNYPLGKDLL